MTHILIPITEFKKHMKETKGYLEQVGLAYWWENGKKISLNEKDIEEKANKVIDAKTALIPMPTSIWLRETDMYKECYKQALRDLL